MSEKPSPVVTSAEVHAPMSEKIAPTVTAASVDGSSTKDPKHSSETKEEAFFPWLEDDAEHQKLSARVITRFPVLGAVGLFGSALSVVFSFLVLHFFDDKETVTGRMPKPAAWLSIILSLNSILVHMAVSQGITVSWWYRATREKTTVADLHNVWATGSSIVTALKQWRVFNYVALATVIVATLPANGIILQNAISTKTVDYNFTDASTTYAIADHLPRGLTATLDTSDNTMDLYLYPWQQAMPRVIGNYDGFYKQNSSGNTCLGYCEGVVRGIGFSTVCQDSQISSDLPLDNQGTNKNAITYNPDDPNVNYTIFESKFVWENTRPYDFNLTTIWKDDSACNSSLSMTVCQGKLGSINYPVAVSFNGSNDGLYYWMMGGRYDNKTGPGNTTDAELDFQPYVANGPETHLTGTTYGGIIAALAAYFDSTITLNLDNQLNETQLKVNGFYAEQLDTYIDVDQLEYRCNISLIAFGAKTGKNHTSYTSPAADLLNQVRNTLFFTSIWALDDNEWIEVWDPAVENEPRPQLSWGDVDQQTISKYHVIWPWYFGSLAITLCVVGFILPTFYGFWVLARKTTLSPFETARAFHAPILHDQPRELDTEELLKTVGNKTLHTDLALASMPSSPISQNGPASPFQPMGVIAEHGSKVEK